MTDKFLVHILNKCGVKVQWYEDKSQPLGYSCLYFLDGFSEKPEQIEESVAMDIALEYLTTQIAIKTTGGLVNA